tara:strand:- start:43 stop:201 length:159 start_codon:yes stop_codon:yes gene_type:complete
VKSKKRREKGENDMWKSGAINTIFVKTVIPTPSIAERTNGEERKVEKAYPWG